MKETTFKIYNDIFKEDDRNSSKFYVLYNPNMRFLLTANEMCTFYQIVHICNLNRNSASLNFLAKLLKTSNKTLQKTTNQLITLKLISRNRSHYGTYYYTLNLEVIAEVYDKLNSCHTLEDREVFCKKYIEDCEKNAVSKNDTPMEEITIPMVKITIPMENFTTPVEKNTIGAMEKISTHISNICIKEDDLNKKNEFNKENESYKEDVAVEKLSKNDMNFDTYFDEIKTAFNADNIETLTKFEDMFSSKEIFDNLSKEDVSELKFYASDAKQRLQRKLNFDKPADADNSNKVDTSTLNKETTDTSTNKTSSNREPKNDANADTSIGLADANSFFNNSNKVETEDKIEMNSLIDELFPEIPTEEDNSNEVANANVINEMADANTSFNFNLNDSLKENNTSNKAFISIKNKKECNPSTFDKSSNTEQINNTDVDNNNPNEVANAENKNNLKMKQQAKEYFKVITNEVNRLNRENSNDVSKLKIYYDVIKTLTIDEIDKQEMLDKCNEYIKEVSSKKTVNKADSSTLNEKTTDSSIEKKSLNTEPKNSTGADVNKEESSKLQQTSRSMEYNRYFNNIQFALSKRCIGTLLQYEKDFKKEVEYLSNDELIDLRNMIADAKQRVQLAMSA